MAGSSSVSARSYKGPALQPLGHHTGKPPIPLHRPVTLIGSRSNARIHLTSSSVSKAHALIVKDGPIAYIRDLASRTHVYVGGEEVRDHDLQDGDLIKIGKFTFKFTVGQERPAQAGPTHLPPGSLRVSGVDYPVPLDQRVILIGRRSSCDVHLLEDSVSTAHAVLFEMNGQRHIRDLGSRTGTFVNGVQVHQHQLNDGDKIRIGETILTYTPNEQFAAVDDSLQLSGTGAGSVAGSGGGRIEDSDRRVRRR
jgi:pSer/pThr/pTyr-binding forkhead associated (FHA) protein